MLTRLASCEPKPSNEAGALILKHLNERISQGWYSRFQTRRVTDGQITAWSFREAVDGTFYIGEAVAD